MLKLCEAKGSKLWEGIQTCVVKFLVRSQLKFPSRVEFSDIYIYIYIIHVYFNDEVEGTHVTVISI